MHSPSRTSGLWICGLCATRVTAVRVCGAVIRQHARGYVGVDVVGRGETDRREADEDDAVGRRPQVLTGIRETDRKTTRRRQFVAEGLSDGVGHGIRGNLRPQRFGRTFIRWKRVECDDVALEAKIVASRTATEASLAGRAGAFAIVGRDPTSMAGCLVKKSFERLRIGIDDPWIDIELLRRKRNDPISRCANARLDVEFVVDRVDRQNGTDGVDARR